MWSAVPKHWFSWDFVVHDANPKPVAEVRLSSWRERGAIVANGVEHKVSRQGILGAFVLVKGDSVVASAEKPSAFRETFELDHEGSRYTLKRRSLWQRALVLYEGEKEIGSDAGQTRYPILEMPAVRGRRSLEIPSSGWPRKCMTAIRR